MKLTIKKPVDYEIKYVYVAAPFRYVGDGDDDDVPLSTPLLKNGSWKAKINIDEGKVEDWPVGESCHLFGKICDEGSYYLIDDTGNIVLSREEDYVPNRLIPGEYGDYIDLHIDENGYITNWYEHPSFEDFIDEEDDW